MTAERDQSATEPYETADLMTEGQLARRFGKTIDTVRRWRRDGEGPPWFKDPGGTVFYRPTAVLAWEEERQDAAQLSPLRLAQPPSA